MPTAPPSSTVTEADRADRRTTRARDDRPFILCLSHLRWDFVFQRPQHLLSRAARDHRVIVFEEPVFFDDLAEPRLDVTPRAEGVLVAVPHLPAGREPTEVMRLQRELVSALVAEHGRPDVLWYYSPMALSFTAHVDAEVVLYDCMDELSAFRGAAPDLTLWERRLFARADFVLAGGKSLWEAKRRQHAAVTCLPSSIDVTHFHKARTGPAEPVDLAPIARPRLGFFGVIDERFDVELLGRMAEMRPDWQFVMLGPVVKIDPATLPKASNIHWLGSKAYADLPCYLGHWDVGIMPFAINESTRYISPTKTPEFLAAGLPVVSTPITDVVSPYGENGLVKIADAAEAFVAACETLIAGPAPGWRERVDLALAAGSWDRSWDTVAGLIATTRDDKRAEPLSRPLFASERALVAARASKDRTHA